MKKIIFSFLFVVLSYGAQAQQLSQYSMYMFNNVLHNPAFLGTKKCAELRVGYRTQWVGYDGNPKDMYASFNYQIKQRRKPYIKARHGIGAYIESDKVGLTMSNQLMLGYAYHMPITRNLYLGGGINVGLKQFSVASADNLVPDVSDPAIATGSRFIYPDITAGLLVYNSKFYAGAALKNTVGNKLKVYGVDARLTRQLNVMAGTSFNLGRLTVYPSALLKYAFGSPFALDATLLFEPNSRLQLGLAYRGIKGGDAVTGIVNFYIKPRWSVGYAYDFPISKLNKFTFQTHELTMAFKICPFRDADELIDTRCPAFTN
ncbi:MAG: type IX secretion system membrane protein PorP/SprF [Bacteroidia bacterium]